MTVNPTTLRVGIDQIDIDGDVSLAVGRRTSSTSLKGNRIAMHRDVTASLRQVCRDTMASLSKREPVVYADSLAIDDAKQYLFVPTDILHAHRRAPGRPRPGEERPQIEIDAAALRLLQTASSLEQLQASELGKKSFLFYAAVVGRSAKSRASFVDRWNPYKAALSGLEVTWFGDRLRRVEGPLLIFERSFDMVVMPDGIAVLDVNAFEAVFRDIDAMTERVPRWADAATAALPFEPTSIPRVGEFATASRRVARQLRSLYEGGAWTKPLPLGALSEELEKQGIDPTKFIEDEQLKIEDPDSFLDLLRVIDEKATVGWRTGTPWWVNTRSRR